MFEFIDKTWLFAGGAALLTMLATGWSHAVSFYRQVASRVIVTITVSGYEAEAITLYLKNRFYASKWGPRAYLGWMLYVRPRRRVQLVPMEISPPTGRIYWQGWKPLWCFKSTEVPNQLEEGENSRNYTYEAVGLSFLRGMFDADQIIIEASDWFNRQVIAIDETEGRRHFIRHIYGTAGKTPNLLDNGKRSGTYNAPSSSTDIRGCLQYRSLVWQFTQLGPDLGQPGTACDTLALSTAAAELVEEARHWKSSEEWYKSRSIPWRRGWMLYGQPGTGKTALARAVAEDLDLPVFVFDLASLHNNELVQEWANMLAEVPCMALIEDIDAVFEQRRNVSDRERQNLTFDCLLNCLDGIERSDGLFTVITTNRIDKIDAALGLPDEHTGSTRPGRIDRVLELGPLDEAGRRKLAARILAEWPGEWEDLIDEGEGDTGAQFQERCARHALSLHYIEENRPRAALSVTTD